MPSAGWTADRNLIGTLATWNLLMHHVHMMKVLHCCVWRLKCLISKWTDTFAKWVVVGSILITNITIRLNVTGPSIIWVSVLLTLTQGDSGDLGDHTLMQIGLSSWPNNYGAVRDSKRSCRGNTGSAGMYANLTFQLSFAYGIINGGGIFNPKQNETDYVCATKWSPIKNNIYTILIIQIKNNNTAE